MAALARRCLKTSREGAFTTVAGRPFQGASVAREKRMLVCQDSLPQEHQPERVSLYPSAKCSGAKWVRARDVYCVTVMSGRPFCILYIIVTRQAPALF